MILDMLSRGARFAHDAVTRSEIVITAENWSEGERPIEYGYIPATPAIAKLHDKGMRARDLLDEKIVMEFNKLVDKAYAKGLNESEARKIAKLSIKINQMIDEALKTPDQTPPTA